MKSTLKSTTNTPAQLDRRTFLKVGSSSAAVFSLGFYIPSKVTAATKSTQTPTPPEHLNAWIEIHPDERIIIRYARVEMGQGSSTSAPMIVAEELDADWKQVQIEYATAEENLKNKLIFGDMSSVGSRTIKNSQEYLRNAGASARAMLVSAAAQSWGVSESECATSMGAVFHKPTQRKLTYGSLCAQAAKLDAPKTVVLKDPKDWKIVGQPIKRREIPDIVVGKIRYAIDTQLPGMLYAAVAASPVFNGTVKSIDSTRVQNRRGIVQVVNLNEFVAVVADNWWRAKEALKEIAIEWETGENARLSTASVQNYLKEGLKLPELAVARKDGNALDALDKAPKVIEAEYFTPYLAHATMEPVVCTVWIQGNSMDVWASSQNPAGTLAVAAATAGLDQSRVKVHPVQLGGGLGRKGAQDYTKQATLIAKAVAGRPVKMIWTREEDIQHDLYRPMSLIKLRAAQKPNGDLDALHIRVSAPSIFASLLKLPLNNGVDGQAVASLNDHPYAVEHCLVDYAQRNTNIPVGFWRSVGHSQNPFARECFIDELAHEVGQDPLAYRLQLLPATAVRDRAILTKIAEAAQWSKPPAKGVFRGIAETEGYGSWTACVCEVSVKERSEVKIHKIVIGIDPGYVVNPDNIQAQLQGSVAHGLSAIFWGEMTIKDGRIEQSNFHDYRMLRLNEMPPVQTVIAPTGGFWGGVGEPAQAPLGPALANAIFAATGKRIRSFPLKNHGFSLAKA